MRQAQTPSRQDRTG